MKNKSKEMKADNQSHIIKIKCKLMPFFKYYVNKGRTDMDQKIFWC